MYAASSLCFLCIIGVKKEAFSDFSENASQHFNYTTKNF